MTDTIIKLGVPLLSCYMLCAKVIGQNVKCDQLRISANGFYWILPLLQAYKVLITKPNSQVSKFYCNYLVDVNVVVANIYTMTEKCNFVFLYNPVVVEDTYLPMYREFRDSTDKLMLSIPTVITIKKNMIYLWPTYI